MSMERTERGPQWQEAVIDYRIIIPAARANDDEALRVFITSTQQQVAASINRVHKKHTIGHHARKDLISAAMEKLCTVGLKTFDPFWPLPPDADPADAQKIIAGRYRKYINKTVRSVLADWLRENVPLVFGEEMPESAPKEPIHSRQKYENRDVTASLLPQLAKILTKEQMDVISLRSEGKTNQEIAQECSMLENTVKARVCRGRQRIESKILTPAGLRDIATFPHRQRIYDQISSGRIPASKILGKWYIQEELTRFSTPESLKDQGYVLLTEQSTSAAIQSFRRIHADKVFRKGARMYIHTRDLPLLIAIAQQKEITKEPITSPDPDFVSIRDITMTEQEYSFIRTAIGKGSFTDIIRRRRTIFVKANKANALLAERRAANKPKQIYP